MPPGLNRALQVRTADRLRAELARDDASGLPLVSTLSEADRRELCDVGGGRVAAVAICVDALAVAESGESEPLHPRSGVERALVVREVARRVEQQIRRTDVLGCSSAETLLILAPGLDAVAGRSLALRLHSLLARSHIEIAGMLLELRVRVGAASRSPASAAAWTARTLGAEAEHHAAEPASAATLA